jgi:poly-gamma-glutamate synthesis protein (capsule biosynthesis protein)
VISVGSEDAYLGNLTFVLVKPFNTVQDDLSNDDVNTLLFENLGDSLNKEDVFLSEATYSIFSDFWGNLSDRLKVVAEEEIFENVIYSQNSFGILGFDDLNPKWKIMSINGNSPFDNDFDLTNYFFNIPVSINCEHENLTNLMDNQEINFISNWDREKITSILITGTTALTRATANRMEQKGNQYPGEMVKSWFDQADIRHVSSETPFYEGCPLPNPFQQDLSFCSRPDYIELFEYLEINIIELTGNHLLDKGVSAFEDTLTLFSETEINCYAGGFSEQEARNSVLIDHHGNKIAFLGCNFAGPPNVWAGSKRSGVSRCDFSVMENQIIELVQEEYLPIVTIQYIESNYMKPPPSQINDFRRLIEAGAIIVSGSQSHVPMTMEIYQNGFIHYGLGNLFFDQMDEINNRRGFIDRHIFYDGKYLGVELLTTMVEDYAQPRPMSSSERESLLSDAFSGFSVFAE